MKHLNKDPGSNVEFEVLRKAVFRVADYFDISDAELSKIIGIKPWTISRLRNKEKYPNTQGIDPDLKEGELSLLLIRIFRNLEAIFGGHQKNEKLWLDAFNYDLNGFPKELLQSVEGISRTVRYLDAMRGKN